MNTYGLATIVKNEEITAGIWKMELAASEIAHTAEPGQFIMLYPLDKRNLLARPTSLSAISEKSVTIVYRIAGKGTKQFSQLQKNDSIRIMGPLGNGFTLPDQATKSIVVGGGLGIPPLLELSNRNSKSCCFWWADAISLINTLRGMKVDIHKRKPVLANRIGGYSGPGIMPVALRMVYEVCHSVDVPVIGMGGFSIYEDDNTFIFASLRTAGD